MTPKESVQSCTIEKKNERQRGRWRRRKEKKKVVKKKPRKDHVIYRLGIAWVCAGERRAKGKKRPPKGQKIRIKDGAYTLRSIQFPHFIIVLFSLSIPVSLWINRVVVSVRSSTLRTRILRPQFSLFHRAIILNSWLGPYTFSPLMLRFLKKKKKTTCELCFLKRWLFGEREWESPAPPLSPLAPLLLTFIPDIFTSYHSPLTTHFSQKGKKDSLRGWVTWPRGPRSILQHLASAEYRFKSLATSWPIPER